MGVPNEIRRVLLRQAGVISRAQALAGGLTPRQLDRLLADGSWVRVHPAVYRLHAVVPTVEADVRSAALWLGGSAVLTGLGAAWWWGCLPEAPSRWTFSRSTAGCPPRSTRVAVDRAFVDRRVALELDGHAYHSGPDAHRADVRRANDVMAAGWTVRRFTWSDLLTDPDGFIATVRDVLAI
ncbi:Protein of unknown function [Friedmanniella luteola]|uniref:Uncharacterized protein n=1 Tax=Friedmanniella luteola TaxID=546871 RepID=A0A1H2A5A9_9ACTN|nr:type IV toxin-antitoxin system AbiEi family antitoxin domain-containing protein [Friedmanniella luteola]SDT41181.1 Protein of unknown function [Friedmanniella luteola]